MSCDEWERGTIIIPAKAWAKFKKEFRDQYNEGRKADYEIAKRLVAATKAANKGKRGVDWLAALRAETGKVVQSYSAWGSNTMVYNFKTVDQYDLEKHLLSPEKKLLEPQKKNFPISTNKTVSWDADLGVVTFIDAEHSVRWSVSENNHACDSARNSFSGRLLFKLLDKVVWCRGSGGKIVGNDEYNRDSRGEGEGGNRVNSRFGPLGKSEDW